MKLWQIAHCRSGDKGDISNIALIAYHQRDYDWLKKEVTARRVQEYFGQMVRGKVVRYELENINALNFVLYGALGGGVTRSLVIDSHGKSLSSYLLNMEISSVRRGE